MKEPKSTVKDSLDERYVNNPGKAESCTRLALMLCAKWKMCQKVGKRRMVSNRDGTSVLTRFFEGSVHVWYRMQETVCLGEVVGAGDSLGKRVRCTGKPSPVLCISTTCLNRSTQAITFLCVGSWLASLDETSVYFKDVNFE